jgi:hypothetical protein
MGDKKMIRISMISEGLSFILFSIALSSFCGDSQQEQPTAYPGAKWDERTPEEVGLLRSKLDLLPDFIGGRGCIVRHGYMVYTWGDQSRCADVASALKPWFSHFLFKAIEEGKTSSLDELVINYEPRLKDINSKLGFKDSKITWRHFANQISCYGVSEPPGTAFDYNDWQMALFGDTLFLKAYGVKWEDVDDAVLHPKLTDLIQCQDDPTFNAFGVGERSGRFAISVRDFARFGLLYLRKGNWNGKQIINEKYAVMAVSDPVPNSIPRTKGIEAEMIPDQRTIGSKRVPDNQGEHFGSYSWLWWLNGTDASGKRMWADAPADTYGAFGHGGIRGMFVIPSLDIVVSYNDAENLEGWVNGSESPLNKAMKIIVEAIIEK